MIHTIKGSKTYFKIMPRRVAFSIDYGPSAGSEYVHENDTREKNPPPRDWNDTPPGS